MDEQTTVTSQPLDHQTTLWRRAAYALLIIAITGWWIAGFLFVYLLEH